MKRLTKEEMMKEVLDGLRSSPYGYQSQYHFSPSDVMPHSNHFKYICKRLCEFGLLERATESAGRWGWFYKVPKELGGR